MDNGHRSVAKVQLMAQMQTGDSWQTAAAKAGLQISQSNAYRLMRVFRQRGEAALSDGRHGHPSKLREAVLFFSQSGRTVLVVFCSLRLLIKRTCFLPLKELSPQTSVLLIHHCVLLTISLQPSAISC
jgi:hypothetical protein